MWPKDNREQSKMNNIIPIGGFWGPVHNYNSPYSEALKNFITDEIYTLIKGLGINFISYIERDYQLEPDEIIENLQMSEKYGIGLYVRDSKLTNETTAEELKERISKYSRFKSFYGIDVCDEPGCDYYVPKSPHIDTFDKLATMINNSGNMNAYVNLFPKFGEYEDLDTVYDNYVEEYIIKCAPKFISYDYYPFIDEQTNKTCTTYYEHLKYFAKKAKKYDIPFWPFVEVGGYFWMAEESFDQRTPTYNQMLWNVNNCIAFGAKGIQYFPMMQPTYWGAVDKNTQDFDRMGLIASNGKPTKWYAPVKAANNWLISIQDIIMNSKHLTVLAKGTVSQKIAAISRESDEGILNGIIPGNEEYGSIVGVMRYNGNPTYYVVNYDYENDQKITLKFENKYDIDIYYQNGNTEVTAGTECNMTLKPGHAALVLLK